VVLLSTIGPSQSVNGQFAKKMLPPLFPTLNTAPPTESRLSTRLYASASVPPYGSTTTPKSTHLTVAAHLSRQETPSQPIEYNDEEGNFEAVGSSDQGGYWKIKSTRPKACTCPMLLTTPLVFSAAYCILSFGVGSLTTIIIIGGYKIYHRVKVPPPPMREPPRLPTKCKSGYETF
ncbi:hypothetical protein PMAYCL1PPCAC_27639, partial [Pristionchus mayeri]